MEKSVLRSVWKVEEASFSLERLLERPVLSSPFVFGPAGCERE